MFACVASGFGQRRGLKLQGADRPRHEHQVASGFGQRRGLKHIHQRALMGIDFCRLWLRSEARIETTRAGASGWGWGGRLWLRSEARIETPNDHMELGTHAVASGFGQRRGLKL